MSGGGGGGAAPVTPAYTDPVNGQTFTSTDALNAEIAQRQAQELDASNQAQAKADAQTATDKATFQQRLSDARSQVGTNVNNYFTNNGYDPNKYASQIANAINTSAQSIPDLAPVPMAAFSPNLGAQVLQDINSGYRTQAQNKINTTFAPTYADDNVSSSWLQPAEDTVLASQFEPLSAQLTNAQKRGTLNNTGYDAALKELAKSRTMAASSVNNLGTNILNNDRAGVNDYITGAKNDAANVNALTFDNFDPNKYVSGASDRINNYHNNFTGDLMNAVGNTSFADLSSLLNAGGVVQGANDPTATNPNGGAAGDGGVSDAYIAQQALANQKRGLGGVGAF